MEEKLDILISKFDKIDGLVSDVDSMKSKFDKIDGLVSDVDSMKSKFDKIDELINDVNSIKSSVTTMQTDMKDLRKDVKNLKKDVKQLQKNDDYMFDSIKDLRERTGRTEEKIDNLTKITDIYGTRLTKQGEKIDISIQNKIDKTNDTMKNLYQESKHDRERLQRQVNELSKIITV